MSNASETSQALQIILDSQRLPIRGWTLTYATAALDPTKSRKIWPIYAVPPETDEHNVVRAEPLVLFYLPSDAYLFRTAFELTHHPFVFQGRPYQFGPEIVDKQVAYFKDRLGMMQIALQSAPAVLYKTERFIPNFQKFSDRVAEWSTRYRMARTEEEHKLASWVCAQLKVIKDRSADAIKTAVQELANIVRQNHPDYFELLEHLIEGRLTPDEVQEKAKGVIAITLTERYTPPPKPTTQTIQ